MDSTATSVSMGEDERDGQLRVAESWCLQPVELSWSGQRLLGGSLVLVKHGLSSCFLLCNEDGQLDIGTNYDSLDAQWKIMPYDDNLAVIEVGAAVRSSVPTQRTG